MSSILPPRELREEVIQDFPQGNFLLFDGFEAAGESIMMLKYLLIWRRYLTAEHINKTTKLKWIMVKSAGMDEMP